MLKSIDSNTSISSIRSTSSLTNMIHEVSPIKKKTSKLSSHVVKILSPQKLMFDSEVLDHTKVSLPSASNDNVDEIVEKIRKQSISRSRSIVELFPNGSSANDYSEHAMLRVHQIRVKAADVSTVVDSKAFLCAPFLNSNYYREYLISCTYDNTAIKHKTFRYSDARKLLYEELILKLSQLSIPNHFHQQYNDLLSTFPRKRLFASASTAVSHDREISFQVYCSQFLKITLNLLNAESSISHPQYLSKYKTLLDLFLVDFMHFEMTIIDAKVVSYND